MQIKRILTWPNTPKNNINPWHVILRRLLSFPIIYLGMSITSFGVFLGWNYYEAKETWRKVL